MYRFEENFVVVPPASFDNVKRRTKLLKKEAGVCIEIAQDVTAEALGHKCFRWMVEAFEAGHETRVPRNLDMEDVKVLQRIREAVAVRRLMPAATDEQISQFIDRWNLIPDCWLGRPSRSVLPPQALQMMSAVSGSAADA